MSDNGGAMMTELKPCPFCGGIDIDLAFSLTADGITTAGCMTCGAVGPESKDQSEAGRTSAWNRRALSQPSAEAVREACVEACLDQDIHVLDNDIQRGRYRGICDCRDAIRALDLTAIKGAG